MKSSGAFPPPMGSDKVLFVDRDGVINRDYVGDYVKRWEDFEFLPGALRSLARLKETGFQVVIVSNQAGIGDGVYKKETLDDITDRMLREVERNGGKIAAIYYCLHGKEAGCECRKPKTGLFKKASRDFVIDPAKTFFIGDKISDIKAGKNFGLRTILVFTGYGKAHSQEITPETAPEFACDNFEQAVDIVLAKTGQSSTR